jgi:transposase
MGQGKKQGREDYSAERLRDLPREELIAIILMYQDKLKEYADGRILLTSRNSSRPPSSDQPGVARPKRPPTGRNRGGQKGHPGHQRQLLPEHQVRQVVPLRPGNCKHCGLKLSGEDRFPDRHQVWDIPPIQPEVVEYQQHTLLCPGCLKTTKGELPAGASASPFSARIQAWIGVLTGAYRLSKRQAASLMKDMLGIPISLGAIPRCEAVVSRALEKPVAEAREYVQSSELVGADETGWPEEKRRAWLWVAVTRLVAVFLIAKTRGRDAARELLGPFCGTLSSDRWGAYDYFTGRRQTCWAHLKRWCVWISENPGAGKVIGEKLVHNVELMFDWWRRVRDGTLSRRVFRRRMRQVRRQVEKLLRRGAVCGQKPVEAKCRTMLKAAPYFWTFVDQEGVEPTNNAAEQALRHAVIWRKCSYGTQSQAGSRFVERVLTAVTTCRLQERSILEYLTAVCLAYRQHDTIPSLLPRSCLAKRRAA